MGDDIAIDRPGLKGNGFLITEVTYLGGHPAHDKKVTGLLDVTPDELRMKRLKAVFTIPWADVTGVFLEGSEEVQKRITATRLATLGVFALAAKKKQRQATTYLTVVTDAGEAIFECNKDAPQVLRAKLQPALAWVAARHPLDLAGVAPTSVADELGKLAELRAAGVLSDDEFATQKAKLLA